MSATLRSALIVDDDRVQRRQISLYLDRVGVRTLEAEDGEAAMQIAREHHPSVIIMDIAMPKMDGLAAAHAIQGIYNPKIILMTGDADSFYRANVERPKVFAVIEKPIPLPNLSRFVLQALE